MLDRKKIALIHIAKKHVGMGDDAYRVLLLLHGGVESARDLDQAGFRAVMAQFQYLGFRSDFNKEHYGERTAMASPGQVALIRKLWREFGPLDPSDDGLGHWLDKSFKVSSIRFLSADLAPKVIAVLKAMVERPRGNRSKDSA